MKSQNVPLKKYFSSEKDSLKDVFLELKKKIYLIADFNFHKNCFINIVCTIHRIGSEENAKKFLLFSDR